MNFKESIINLLEDLEHLERAYLAKAPMKTKDPIQAIYENYYLGKAKAYGTIASTLKHKLEFYEPMKKKFFLLWRTPTKSGWGYYFSPVSYEKKEVAEAEARRLERYKPEDDQEFIRVVEVEIE